MYEQTEAFLTAMTIYLCMAEAGGPGMPIAAADAAAVEPAVGAAQHGGPLLAL